MYTSTFSRSAVFFASAQNEHLQAQEQRPRLSVMSGIFRGTGFAYVSQFDYTLGGKGTMKKPAWRRRFEVELAEAGITEEEFQRVRGLYEVAGLSLARVPSHGWRIFGVPRNPAAPTTCCLWAPLDVLVADHEQIITDFKVIDALRSVPWQRQAGQD
jgi:hypothetical protein